MNLIVVILIGIIIWLVYALLQSYRNLAEKIDIMSQNCKYNQSNKEGSGSTSSSNKSVVKSSYSDPVENMKDTLLYVLSSVKNYAS